MFQPPPPDDAAPPLVPHHPCPGRGRTGAAAARATPAIAPPPTPSETRRRPGPPLTADDLRRHSRLAWACLAALAAVAAWFWLSGRRAESLTTAAALAGCLGLVLPPRERMPLLPWRLRALPRRWDAAPVLATLLSSPGYALGWFNAPNPYDEAVHLLNGALAGAVLAALLRVDGRRRSARGLSLAGLGLGLAIGAGWEVFEWATGLIGTRLDTWTDVALTALGATLGAVVAGRPRGAPPPSTLRCRARGLPGGPRRG